MVQRMMMMTIKLSIRERLRNVKRDLDSKKEMIDYIGRQLLGTKTEIEDLINVLTVQDPIANKNQIEDWEKLLKKINDFENSSVLKMKHIYQIKRLAHNINIKYPDST